MAPNSKRTKAPQLAPMVTNFSLDLFGEPMNMVKYTHASHIKTLKESPERKTNEENEPDTDELETQGWCNDVPQSRDVPVKLNNTLIYQTLFSLQ